MAEHTLEAMAAGGIHDQIGGGFHRYATDARWLVPHFEKMLYDNALLAVAYLEAYQVTGRADFAAVTRDILAYVGREMTAPSGAFYSASDADSDGVEGAFFVWTPAQMRAVLSPDDGGWPKRTTRSATRTSTAPASCTHPQPLAAVAQQLGLEPAAAAARARRDSRGAVRRAPGPRAAATDRKILPAWNGLMISAFARAGAGARRARVRRRPPPARRPPCSTA